MEDALRSRIGGGTLLVGTVVTLPDVALAELTAGSFDFVWIDMEHGALGCADVQALAIGARAAGTPSLVRVRDAHDRAIGPVLDAGVDGIVVPRVESADDAAAVVGRLRHPPHGSRGLAARRALSYGRATAPRRRPVCMVQVESAAGVADSDAIAAVDGVDALVVGCADLALSLGAHTGPRSPRFRHAVTRVQEAAEAAGIASGIAGPDDPALLSELAGGRSTVLVLAADVRIYARALDTVTRALRRELALRVPEGEECHVGA